MYFNLKLIVPDTIYHSSGIALYEKFLLVPTHLVIDVTFPYVAFYVTSYTFCVF